MASKSIEETEPSIQDPDYQQVQFIDPDQTDAKSIGDSYHRESRWEALVKIFRPVLYRQSMSFGRQSRRSTYDASSKLQWKSDAVSVHSAPFVPVSKSDAQKASSVKSLEDQRPRRRHQTMASAAKHTQDRIKDALERIKKIKLPSGLLRRRNENQNLFSSLQNRQPNAVKLALNPFLLKFETHRLQNIVPCVVEFLQLTVRDVDIESDSNAFFIDLKYGEITWTIRRTIIDLFKLHTTLRISHFQHPWSTFNIPHFPSQVNYAFEKAKAYASRQDTELLRGLQLVRLRNKRRQAMQTYLKDLIDSCFISCHEELCRFLEIGWSLQKTGYKGKEGYVKKGQRSLVLNKFKVPVLKKPQRVWFSIRDSYVAMYDNVLSNTPIDVLQFDVNTSLFQVTSINPFKHKIFILKNEIKELKIKVDSDRKFNELMRDLSFSIQKSPWCNPHRYNSFAPIRSNQSIKFLVDAKNYYLDVHDAIISAKKIIYIEGWWISPMIYLKRPEITYPNSRLDLILKKKAEEGVKIYICMYKEVTYALNINSAYSKQVLNNLHPNIRVVRFPNHVPGGVYYWALHEKLVVVDEDIGFLGGLDLALGRYDDCNHSVTENINNNQVWIGQDYFNPRIKDFESVQHHQSELVDKTLYPRMPWHDVSIQVCGSTARDLARHFVQRWNFVKGTKYNERQEPYYILPPLEFDLSSQSGSMSTQILRSCSEWSLGKSREQSIYEAYLRAIKNSKHYIYIENQFFISNANTDQPSIVKNRIAEALVQRIIDAQMNNQQFKVYIVIPLLPAFENDVSDGITTRLIFHWHQMTLRKGQNSLFEQLLAKGIDPENYLSVCSLRNFGKLYLKDKNGDFIYVSEQVYIHSKVMIVDDDIAIIGSANINDRSLTGNRDSEVAIIIQDEEKEKIQNQGDEILCSKQVRQLRIQLIEEHSNLSHNFILENFPNSDKFFTQWKSIAQNNTIIYRDIFNCTPDDNVQTWSQYNDLKSNLSQEPLGHASTQLATEDITAKLQLIQGFLVQYPLIFLILENLGEVYLPAKEAMISMDVFL